MNDDDRMTMRDDNYSMLSEEEVLKAFPDNPEVITNTKEIADKCNLKLELGGIIIPDFPVPKVEPVIAVTSLPTCPPPESPDCEPIAPERVTLFD